MTNTIEPLGSVGTVRAAVNVPAAEEQRDGAVDTNDNFTLSNALDDFNVCARSNNATGLGCAVLVAGSVTSFLWARGKAGVLTMLGDIAGAAKVLEAEARAAVKENRVREAISLFREAKGLYRRANDQQKAAETGREYAEANELLGKGLAVQAGSGERAARFLQESARAYSEIGLHERAVVVFLELAPLYGGMNKPEMSAGSLESAGRNYARAGRFTAAAEMFAEAGELREKNHLPDEPDNLTMVSGYRSLQQKIEYARGQGDIRKAARLETELAERIISHYLTEFAPHGCDVFARDFAYHSRVASELHLQAGEYTLAMERLARLTTVLWKEGMDGHAGVEYLNTVLRALEVTKGLLSRGQPDRRQKEKDLAKYVRAFEDAYEKVPFRTKREGRYGKIVGDYLRAGQLYVIAGKREKAKEMFQRAAAQFADERFEQDARAIAVEAEDALGLDGPERVRKKWNDIAPPMTSAERKARIGSWPGR
jgi:tetratricopeptide (TPR) repeat protein